MTLVEVNGIRLNVERRGNGPVLLLLHGFTGSGRNWSPLLDAWRGFTTVTVDLIGHGASDCPWEPERYSMDACVADLVAVLDTLGGQRVALLGYSMGGRVALHFAVKNPERLWALVLESASPGIADPPERRQRVASDALLAEQVEANGVEKFVDYWEQLPMWASQASLPVERRSWLRQQRLANAAAGLANSLRGMGAGAQEPLFERLGEVAVPTLLVVGALDARYRELGEIMARALPCAEMRVIEAAGHATHFEQPEAFAGLVSQFLIASIEKGSLEA